MNESSSGKSKNAVLVLVYQYSIGKNVVAQAVRYLFFLFEGIFKLSFDVLRWTVGCGSTGSC